MGGQPTVDQPTDSSPTVDQPTDDQPTVDLPEVEPEPEVEAEEDAEADELTYENIYPLVMYPTDPRQFLVVNPEYYRKTRKCK